MEGVDGGGHAKPYDRGLCRSFEKFEKPEDERGQSRA